MSASNSYATDAAGNFRIQLGSIDIGAYEASNTNPDQGATLATSAQSVQADQNSVGSTVYASGCESLIATVAGVGSEQPVRGNVTARVWVEASQPDGFVKRHYEIFPAENAGSAEGRVTLYFSQEEFNAFNATASKPLPANATDAAGKANLRIEKRGGQSQEGAPDATGLPNTYTGGISTIDPQDSDIIWNADHARWEISFDVKGFSGFFVKTQGGALPVELVSFQAVKEGAVVQLHWETASEVNSETFVIMRSADGKKWSEIGSVAAAQTSNSHLQYKFTDAAPLAGENLYKLKMIDADGTFA
ncbi:hypothetical protein [Dyadobacter fermentans]|uniref:hypothetical protein n=1 Tax=Dyadobacter fermentans TaxID=94254 RepID=UPI0002F02CE5|nr:hypothetical protein [Dyadobacter fermentans]